jgi:hypothetical protein
LDDSIGAHFNARALLMPGFELQLAQGVYTMILVKIEDKEGEKFEKNVKSNWRYFCMGL